MEGDSQLVARSIAGDRSAFGILYDRYAPIVRSVCYASTGETTVALELSQEVFLRGYARLGKLKNPDRFGPWLVAMARFVCREWRRRRRRDKHHFMANPPESAADGDRDQSEELAELRREIAKLPEQERLALQLYYSSSEAVDVVCENLGMARSSFYQLLARVKKKLAARLHLSEEETV